MYRLIRMSSFHFTAVNRNVWSGVMSGVFMARPTITCHENTPVNTLGAMNGYQFRVTGIFSKCTHLKHLFWKQTWYYPNSDFKEHGFKNSNSFICPYGARLKRITTFQGKISFQLYFMPYTHAINLFCDRFFYGNLGLYFWTILQFRIL